MILRKTMFLSSLVTNMFHSKLGFCVSIYTVLLDSPLSPEELQVSFFISSLHKADTCLALPHLHGLLYWSDRTFHARLKTNEVSLFYVRYKLNQTREGIKSQTQSSRNCFNHDFCRLWLTNCMLSQLQSLILYKPDWINVVEKKSWNKRRCDKDILRELGITIWTYFLPTGRVHAQKCSTRSTMSSGCYHWMLPGKTLTINYAHNHSVFP